MPKVIFKFDKEKDLWNHWHKSNFKVFSKMSNVEPAIREICSGKEFKECKEELETFLKKIHSSSLIQAQIKSVQEAWNLIEEEFFSRMDNLMKKEFKTDIIGYLTTARICPYNSEEKWFMFSFFSGFLSILETCGHEIMHLYFHEFYWEEIEKQIGKVKTADLKEALTVLLNLEFKDLWFARDSGHEQHKDLRKFISQEWKKEKDIESLLEKCVNYLKN